MKGNKKSVILNAARTEEQKRKMAEIIKERICPFCPKYLKEYHDNPIEKIGKYWSITKNDYPYEGSKYHYLFIYNKHVEHIEKITEPAFVEILEHIKWLTKKYKLPAGGFVMRFGEPEYTGASVTHLHAHLIFGKKQAKNSKSLDVPIGYK